MTINNWNAFKASIWNWARLRPCFPRGIEPTDIDGFVEISGYFLVLEGKAPNVPLKEGQRRTFERMQRWNQTVPRLFTIIVIWGDAAAGRIEQLQFWPSAPFAGGWAELLAYVQAWREFAEGDTAPNRTMSTQEPAPVVIAHRQVQRVDLQEQRVLNATQISDDNLVRNLLFARANRDDADCRAWVEILEAEQQRRGCVGRSI